MHINIRKEYFLIFLKRNQTRQFSLRKKIVSAHKKKYAETILLPTTSFPLRIPSAKRSELEIKIQEVCGFNSLYAWQREAYKDKPQFILLDGPPYANGDPHMGHLVNKVLKDIVIRHKLLTGSRIHYVPGWDCHGLPIELKVIKAENEANYTPLEIRERARNFAFSAIKTQKKAFKRWGVMADWDNCYLTMSKDYEIAQMKSFYELYEKGLVYRDFKPVYWSPSTRTALAEAELEYDSNYQSTCLYVKFPIKTLPTNLKPYKGKQTIYALIWTTTPWTLPTNECIAYNKQLNYSLVRSKNSGDSYIIASELCSKLEKVLSLQFENIVSFEGKSLNNVTYIHPMRKEELRFLPAAHVTAEKGTGLVHSSPSHGLDDYNLGLKYNLPMKNYLDDRGCFTNECYEESLRGKAVLDDANETVISLLDGYILETGKFVHSYPHDWRSKKPVIVKPSLQWFINTDKIKNSALDFLKQTDIFPSSMLSGMIDQLKKRPLWCISRQRTWGLPIPAFYEKESKKTVLNKDLINYWCELTEKHGSDMWWSLPNETLLPRHILNKNALLSKTDYEKSQDILDIWFDSGISWKYVLKDVNFQADVCLEGVDQSRGWFQSLLLTSVALQDKPPYKKLFYHGFVLDEEGKKMSKSLGNVIDPQKLIDGESKDKSKALGADTLRWWVANHAIERSSVCIKQAVLDECSQNVQKIRAVLRHLLGNLSDFDSNKDLIALDHMEIIDRYILHLLHQYRQKVNNAYDSFKFDQAATLTVNFVTSRVSAFYLNLIRERLYCGEQNGMQRRSCQTALHHIFMHLVYSIAPFLPHLVEEAFLHHHQFGDMKKLVFRNKSPDCLEEWNNPKLELIMETVNHIYLHLNKELTPLGKAVGEVDLTIEGSQLLIDKLKLLQTDQESSYSNLCETLRVSSVLLTTQIKDDSAILASSTSYLESDNNGESQEIRLYLRPAKGSQCVRCRRYVVPDSTKDICSFCLDVIGNQWS